MNWINAKTMTAMLASVLVAGTGAYLVQQIKTTRLRNENQRLQVQQEKLTSERDAALSAAANDDPERALKEKSELLRLRGEVGLLRQQKSELERLRNENEKLQIALAKPEKNIHQLDGDEGEKQKAVAIMKMNNAKQLVLGMLLYADDQQAQFPKSFEDVVPYLGEASNPSLTNFSQFELLYHGSQTNIKSPSTTIVVREKQAFEWNGKWQKTYGFADGHSEIKREPNEGFDAWEKEHMIPPAIIP